MKSEFQVLPDQMFSYELTIIAWRNFFEKSDTDMSADMYLDPAC